MSADDNLPLLPNSCLIASPNGVHETGTGVPFATHVAILSEGLVYVECQESCAGKTNPVAYGVCCDRRNSPGRRQRHRSFCQIQAPSPPPSSPSPRPKDLGQLD